MHAIAMLDFTRHRLHAAHAYFAAAAWQDAASQARARAADGHVGPWRRGRAIVVADAYGAQAALQASCLLAAAQRLLGRADAFATYTVAATTPLEPHGWGARARHIGRSCQLVAWASAAALACGVQACSLSVGAVCGAAFGCLHAAGALGFPAFLRGQRPFSGSASPSGARSPSPADSHPETPPAAEPRAPEPAHAPPAYAPPSLFKEDFARESTDGAVRPSFFTEALALDAAGDDAQPSFSTEDLELDAAGDDAQPSFSTEDLELDAAGDDAQPSFFTEALALDAAGDDAQQSFSTEDFTLDATGDDAEPSFFTEDITLDATGDDAQPSFFIEDLTLGAGEDDVQPALFAQRAPPASWFTSNEPSDHDTAARVEMGAANSSSGGGPDSTSLPAEDASDADGCGSVSGDSNDGFAAALFSDCVDDVARGLFTGHLAYPGRLTRAARQARAPASVFTVHDSQALTAQLDFVCTHHLRKTIRRLTTRPHASSPPTPLLSCDKRIRPSTAIKDIYCAELSFAELKQAGASLLFAVQRQGVWKQAKVYVRQGGKALTAALARQCSADMRWMRAVMAFTEVAAIESLARTLRTSAYLRFAYKDRELVLPQVLERHAFFYLEPSRGDTAYLQLGFLHEGDYAHKDGSPVHDAYQGPTYVGVRLCVPRPERDGSCWPHVDQVWLASDIHSGAQTSDADSENDSDSGNDSDLAAETDAALTPQAPAGKKREGVVWFI